MSIQENIELKEGQLVRVRNRRWLIEEVEEFPVRVGPQHAWFNHSPRVKLACVEDDSAGELLEVLWDLEVDAKVLESSNSFDIKGLDNPREFGAYLHAVRWNCITSTDPELLQSPFRAGIDLKPYQLEPLRKALSLPRVNLFIADDVGLGKTIEAGLVMQEMVLRQRVEFVLIVAPPAVTRQWQEEMEQRFGLPFEIYNSDFVSKRRRERGHSINPWTTHNRFIVSYALLRGQSGSTKRAKRTNHLELLVNHLNAQQGDASVLSKSMLILDEAHQVAPASASIYPVDSRTTRAIRELSVHFEHKLFLSATPHNGHSSSFSSLLEMLDPQRFTRGVDISGAEELQAIMVRRLKRHLQEEDAGFPKRELVDHILDAGEDSPEIQLAKMFKRYEKLYRAGLNSISSKKEKAAKGLVLIHLHKRLLSSVPAFYRTLRKHRESAQKFFTEQDTKRTVAALEARSSDDGLTDEELDTREDEFVSSATVGISQEAMNLLDEMLNLASAYHREPDARLKHFGEWIKTNLISNGEWNNRRVVIFTEYEDTLQWMMRELPELLPVDCTERIEKYHGGLGEKNRERLRAAFNTNPAAQPLRILMCTDAAREGINLQAHCADLFHFDLPWNPSRVEQRNGRIDRVLQPSPVIRCHYFIVKQRPEDKVLKYVVKKLERIRSELGSVSEVVSVQMAEYVENNLQILSEQYEGLDVQQAVTADDNVSLIPELDKFESDFEKSARLASQQLESDNASVLRGNIENLRTILTKSKKRLEYKPGHLFNLVDLGLRMFNSKKEGLIPITPTTEPASWKIPGDMDASWGPVLDRMREDRTEDMRFWQKAKLKPIAFEAAHKLDANTTQLHLGHPLVIRLLNRFRSQGFSAHDLSRVTLLVNSKDAYRRVVAFARLTIFGPNAVLLHEEMLVVSGRCLDDGSIQIFKERGQQTTVDELFNILEDIDELHPSVKYQSQVLGRVRNDFNTLWTDLEEQGKRNQVESEALLQKRGEEEADNMRVLLERQRQRIEARIDGPQQLSLVFTANDKDQQAQFERDKRHMRTRLEAIEREIEEEPIRIQSYYQTKRARIEPIGMVYLWPRN